MSENQDNLACNHTLDYIQYRLVIRVYIENQDNLACNHTIDYNNIDQPSGDT